MQKYVRILFAEIHFKKFAEIYLKFFAEIRLENFADIQLENFSNNILNIFRGARRALLLGPKGPIVAVEGCSPPQELEKAARRAAIFLLFG